MDVDAKESTPATPFGRSREIARSMNDVRDETQPLGRKFSQLSSDKPSASSGESSEIRME